MKNTGIKVTEVTREFVRENPDNVAYNARVWYEKVDGYAKYADVKFYHAAPQNGTAYDRFYVQYKIGEGLFLFGSLAMTSSLTNAGFARVVVINGEIQVNGFGNDGSERVVNNREGRKWLVDNLCKYGVVVTNEF